MPGRYLLIEFDDEAQASSLRAQIDAASSKGKRYRVVGLFARPGKPCICPYIPGERAKDRVKRGGRLGWWVCTSCKKPRLGDHDLVNLIKPEDVIEPARFAGVDTLSSAMQEKEYIRDIPTIPIITLPARVATGNKS